MDTAPSFHRGDSNLYRIWLLSVDTMFVWFRLRKLGQRKTVRGEKLGLLLASKDPDQSSFLFKVVECPRV